MANKLINQDLANQKPVCENPDWPNFGSAATSETQPSPNMAALKGRHSEEEGRSEDDSEPLGLGIDRTRMDELERQLLNGNLKVKRQRRPSMLRSTGVRIIRHGVRLFPERSD